LLLELPVEVLEVCAAAEMASSIARHATSEIFLTVSPSFSGHRNGDRAGRSRIRHGALHDWVDNRRSSSVCERFEACRSIHADLWQM